MQDMPILPIRVSSFHLLRITSQKSSLIQRLDSYMFCYLDLIIHKAQEPPLAIEIEENLTNNLYDKIMYFNKSNGILRGRTTVATDNNMANVRTVELT
jgi:hypothetical protein